MTEQELWNIATAGDGTLDPVLAQQAGMTLEKFIEEKERRKAQAAAERERLAELNRNRSTGSLQEAEEPGEFLDPTLSARQHLADMEEAYHSTPAEQLEGQETLPGFEEPEPAALDADTVKKNISRVSFKVDYLKSPEDALIAYDAPAGKLKEYLSRHFQTLVNEVARLTGADPEQIADKDKRTPEQDQLLTEVAGRMQIARINAFFNSKYMDAAAVLEPLQGAYKDPTRKDQYTAEELLTDFDPNAITVKDQTVLYYFAIHDEIKPTEQGKLTPEQRKDLTDIFYQINDFYLDHENDPVETDIPQEYYLFSLFIEAQHPAAGEAEKIAEAMGALTDKLPVVSALTPRFYIMPNNALANALLQQGAIEAPETAEGFDLLVATEKRGKKRKEITAYTMVTYDPGNSGVTITDAKLTRHERAVTNGIVSLWVEAADKEAKPIFTIDQIYRAMPGGGDKASAQQRGAITKAIDKFTRLKILVNATQEMQRRGQIKEGGKFIIEEYFLNVRKITAKMENGGKEVVAYEILSQPVIYSYSKLVNQIISIPAKYTAIQKVKKNPVTGKLEASGEYLAMTETRQAMTDYILQRIAVMQNDLKRAKEDYRSYNARRRKDKTLEEKPLAAFRQQSETILFDSLFADVGLADQNRQDAARNRDFVYDVLTYQTVAGNIKGFSEQRKGNKITGVNIRL